ncbi:MAG: BREX-1 system adenine-specific DNA-methyltransferase PglX [Spiribacter salinus]|uniref:site-specific DNA-methyltransferase (adenine-specific) n=1 Tax=Spiribacter salinus TaxID=1335746 RepID=A0A540VPX3_9GAMM|nr:MAG: BREX-1 system adenine-specific DNA-methyltransferase PglX [Spiribacter salinus]
MDTGKLKKFAQAARRELIQQTAGKLEQVLAEGSLARREQARAVAELEKEIQAHGRDEVIERAAYTWFNRLTALRFMDAQRYNRIMAVSPAEGQSQPEILAEAKQGHIDEQTVPQKVREQVFALLDGRAPSRDPQAEAYRLLLVAVCNYWHQAMPFLFERISDWTELLMPDDLLSDTAVRTRIRSVLSAEDCQDVEVIGWLYQFYISEKKDEVFAGLKKGKKITPENIPAATQLFTPHWIVRYLVENSLGRLWLLNRPNSRLAERMDYYIAPEEPETDFLKISKPEEIKLCDPACGSGHMLTYAFDLLYAIYEEEGYAPDDIPALILKHNLTGIEIDERAGALAAFALAMKAAEKLGRRKFLKLAVQPNIVVLQDVRFSEEELEDYMAEVGRDLFTADLRETLGQFEQAKNFGSLIQPALNDPTEVRRVLGTKDFEGNLFLSGTHQRVLDVIRMAEAISPKYHVVVANPPYMGGKGMNADLSRFAKSRFQDSKSDLFAMFIERSLQLLISNGMTAMITMQAWMFLSSFEKLRKKILENAFIPTMAHLGERAFDTIGGAVVSTTAFILGKARLSEQAGDYIRLVDGDCEAEKSAALITASRRLAPGMVFRVSPVEFGRIPGSPLVYWLPTGVLRMIADSEEMGQHVDSKQGLATANNERFMRSWHEVSLCQIGFNIPTSEDAEKTGLRWFPINKGGQFRKWYGNHEFIVNWQADGREIKAYVTDRYPYLNGNIDYVIKDRGRFFHESISWSDITTGANAFRLYPKGFLYDATGHSAFTKTADDSWRILSFCNSRPCELIARAINPTVHFHIGYFDKLPWPAHWDGERQSGRVLRTIAISHADWDAYETSWDFTTLPLLSPDHRGETLADSYATLRTHWQCRTDKMQRLEEENNRIFIEAYGLQDELTPEVPIEEITLTCNPAYRYGVKISEEEREKRLLADTIAEFLSYAVGCMFGRYSLDKPGLVLANQGETLADYLAQVPKPSFMPDEDNVITILDDTWFTDDIVERFHAFLRVTFGKEHFQENLEFIEDAIGKPVRKYFLKDFYKDHVQRYKKRPIYWLFSSPKGSFNALIYMHRYRPDTVSVILNEYLREFRTKLAARVQQLEEIEASAASSARDKTAALKEISKLRATIAELEDWERKVLLPLASEKIEIDLDDGVKANYPRFGAALAKVTGLSK